MLTRAYLAFGVACLSWYAASSLAGWEYDNPRRYRVPVAAAAAGVGYVGRSPGGTTSSHSGSSGFGGGK